jgi:yersiniabactin salicyl-AMP ligase
MSLLQGYTRWVCVREHVLIQLPNGNAFVILLFALLRLGVIPVLAMPSQRALDIDALMALAQPAAYVIHGESHADLARQMARKHACLRQVLVAGETEGDDFTPSSRCAANGRRGRSPMLPAPRCCCSQAAPPGRQSLSRDGTLTIAITSAPPPNCAALSHRACISPSSPWRITFRWPAPVFWEPLPAAEKWY